MHATPCLEIYPDRIRRNAQSVLELAHKHDARVACVTKVTCAHPAVLQAFVEGGADTIADSRIENLFAIQATGCRLPRLLLRLPAISQATDVVRAADISLNSSYETVRALSDSATLLNLRHQVILMVDVGDLREGTWPDRTVDLVQRCAQLKQIEVIGLGCNLACFGGVIPSIENMNLLIETRDLCRAKTGLTLDTLSGGNSSGLPLLSSGKMPKAINHFRIGEAIVLGRNVLDRSPWQGTRQDTFRLIAEVIEVERKPSVPIGNRGQDAFGGSQDFVDRGRRLRAICNIGRQDVVVDGITPEDSGIEVLGGSSDHLILDIEQAQGKIEVGSRIAFYPGYGALLALTTSNYVRKLVVTGE